MTTDNNAGKPAKPTTQKPTSQSTQKPNVSKPPLRIITESKKPKK